MKIMDTLKRVKVGSEKEEDGILHAREIVNYYLVSLDCSIRGKHLIADVKYKCYLVLYITFKVGLILSFLIKLDKIRNKSSPRNYCHLMKKRKEKRREERRKKRLREEVRFGFAKGLYR